MKPNSFRSLTMNGAITDVLKKGNSLTFSPVDAFQTGNCTLYAAEDLPKVIPPFGTPATATSVLTVPTAGSGIIKDLNVVGLQGFHTSVSDLSVTLERSGVPTRRLFGGICTPSDENFNLSFDDEAPAGGRSGARAQISRGKK